MTSDMAAGVHNTGALADEKQQADGAFPYKEHASLKHHTRAVSVLEIEPRSGYRILSGSHDSTMAFWDFGSMNTRFEPFRVIEPFEAQSVRALRYSPDGKHVLVSASAACIQMHSREGLLEREFVKGDQYIRDLRQTHGHVAAINGLEWRDEATFASWAADGTVRWWNIESNKNTAVLSVRGLTGGARPNLTVTAFAEDRKLLYTASDDGMLRVYAQKGPWTNTPQAIVEHRSGEVTDMRYYGEQLLAMRTTDDSVVLWDTRRIKEPLAIRRELSNSHSETSLLHIPAGVFHPGRGVLLTGTSVRKNSGQSSQLVVLDACTLDMLCTESMGASSAISLAWHPKLEQLFVGSGDGSITALYSKERSQKGVLLALARPASKTSTSPIYIPPSSIITPFGPEENNSEDVQDMYAYRRLRAKQRSDPKSSHRPDLPISGFGHGGRIGSSVTQSIMKGLVPDRSREQDPREALLSFAEQAERNPLFVAPAYKSTQPKPVLDATLLEREAEAEGKRVRELNEAEEEAVRQAVRRKLKHQ